MNEEGYKIDVYEVQYGPHRGKFRWTISAGGVPVDANHSSSRREAEEEASGRLALYLNKSPSFR